MTEEHPPETKKTAYLGFGSNLGDRKRNLEQALLQLRTVGLQVRRVSSIYESAPQGPVTHQPSFYNAVAQVETTLELEGVLTCCLQVEHELGRERLVPKGPRTIDVDVLLVGDTVVDKPDLVVPHPELTRRAFALIPLLELSPMAIDPRDGGLLCRHVGTLLRCQPMIRLGSLPSFPAGVRLPLLHTMAPSSAPAPLALR